MRARSLGAIALALLAVIASACGPEPIAPAVPDHAAPGAGPVSPERDACAAGDSDACERLADRDRREPSSASRRADRDLLDRLCGRGIAGACVGFGMLTENEDLAVAFYVRGCAGGSARGCERLGDAYENGRGVPRDEARAAPLYRTACERGLLSSCVRAGKLLGPSDAKAARALFEKACDAADLEGCAALAGTLALGFGAPRDLERARPLYQRACEGGVAAACTALGVMLSRGDGVPRDEARAAELLQAACARDHALGCHELASLLSTASPPVRDDALALSLWMRACSAGQASACANAGALVGVGRGAAADPARAAELWQRACDGGSAIGCARLGVAALAGNGVRRDFDRARDLLQRACDGGQAPACDALGMAFASGAGVPRDDARAEALFRKACELGSATGCTRLGLGYLNRPAFDSQRYDRGIAQAAADCRRTALACDWLGSVPKHAAIQAFDSLVEACDAEIAAACSALARAITGGRVPREASTKLLAHIDKACVEGGKPLWCRRLGYWHERGLGMKRNLPLARRYYRRACDAGDARACTDLGRMLATGEGGERSEQAAVALLRTTCEKGREGFGACGHLGMLLLGHASEAERAEGATLLIKACEGADALACYRVGMFHAKGTRGFPRDELKAVHYFERACAESGQACSEAKALREKRGVEF